MFQEENNKNLYFDLSRERSYEPACRQTRYKSGIRIFYLLAYHVKA